MRNISEIFVYAFVLAISPGPINTLSAAYGKKFGLANSIGFISGASLGFMSLAIIVAMGLNRGIEHFPLIIDFLKLIFCAYMIVISGLLIFSSEERILGINYKFFDGFLIQWANPLSWIVTTLVASKFSSHHDSLIFFVSIELIFEFICLALWAYTGEIISKTFSSPKQQKIFDVILGLFLCAIAIKMLLD